MGAPPGCPADSCEARAHGRAWRSLSDSWVLSPVGFDTTTFWTQKVRTGPFAPLQPQHAQSDTVLTHTKLHLCLALGPKPQNTRDSENIDRFPPHTRVCLFLFLEIKDSSKYIHMYRHSKPAGLLLALSLLGWWGPLSRQEADLTPWPGFQADGAVWLWR